MAAFATPAELAVWSGTEAAAGQAEQALAIASAQIRTACGWSVSQESGAVATLDGSGKPALWLPTLRLTEVASVVEDGVALTAVTDFDWSSSGRLVRAGRWWTSKPRSVVVTYTHGYATVPDDVKGVCMSLASRAMQNPVGVRTQAIDDYTVTYAGSAAGLGPSLGEAERSVLTAYRLPAVA